MFFKIYKFRQYLILCVSFTESKTESSGLNHSPLAIEDGTFGRLYGYEKETRLSSRNVLSPRAARFSQIIEIRDSLIVSVMGN